MPPAVTQPLVRSVMPAVFLMLLAALGAGAITRPGDASASPTLGRARITTQERDEVARINRFRRGHGRAPLVIDPQLDVAANWMGRDMAAKDYFSHTDSCGRDPFMRMKVVAHYRDSGWRGENLASGHGDFESTFQQWKHSPEHRQILLNPRFRVIGIAETYNADSTYGWYWTADFGQNM